MYDDGGSKPATPPTPGVAEFDLPQLGIHWLDAGTPHGGLFDLLTSLDPQAVSAAGRAAGAGAWERLIAAAHAGQAAWVAAVADDADAAAAGAERDPGSAGRFELAEVLHCSMNAAGSRIAVARALIGPLAAARAALA